MDIRKKLNLILSLYGQGKAIGIDTVTPTRHTGTENKRFEGRVKKHQTGLIVVPTHPGLYTSEVNIVRSNEGLEPNFESSPESPWGFRMPQTPFIVHDYETYLECIIKQHGSVRYTFDDTQIKKSELPGLVEYKPARQRDISEKVLVRCINLKNIISIKGLND